MKLSSCLLVCACLLASRAVEAFLPAAVNRGAVSSTLARRASSASSSSPVALRQNQNVISKTSFGGSPMAVRRDASRYVSGRPSATTMGLFGLGAPEIAVCLVVAALILGPDKLAGVAKDVGKMAGELKDVPREFQAGIEEGEAALKQNKALSSKPASAVLDAEEATEQKKEKEEAM